MGSLFCTGCVSRRCATRCTNICCVVVDVCASLSRLCVRTCTYLRVWRVQKGYTVVFLNKLLTRSMPLCRVTTVVSSQRTTFAQKKMMIFTTFLENKLATSILPERGGGVQIPCFTLPINFASKWPASVAFGRLSPCVRGEKPKHLRKTHTQNFFWRSESPIYTRYTYASDKVCCARDRVFRALKVLAASEYTRSKTSSGLGGQG